MKEALMFLKKKTGGSAIGPHEWTKDGDTVEVSDTLGAELLAIDPEEYAVVDKKPSGKDIPDVNDPPVEAPALTPGKHTDGQIVSEASPK